MSILRNIYQRLRYGAVQRPFPDWSQVRMVQLVNGYTSECIGVYDRETHEIIPSEGVHLEEYEIRWLKEWAGRTNKATVIFPFSARGNKAVMKNSGRNVYD